MEVGDASWGLKRSRRLPMVSRGALAILAVAAERNTRLRLLKASSIRFRSEL
jgi:hypothetical protein